MEDLRIGVIGLGQRSSLAELAHRPGQASVVVAVCDSDPATLGKRAHELGAEIAVTDYRDLLDAGLDAVLIATPDDTHAEIACSALEAGLPVFLEKPLATTIEDCDAILAAAARSGTRLYVGHNMRHMGVVRLMREIIARGEIGEPRTIWVRHFVGYGGSYYFKDWHADRRHTTGLLLQKAAHDLDVVHWLAGAYTERVNALGALMLYGDLPRRPAGTPAPEGWLTDRAWPPAAATGLYHQVDVEDVSVMNMRLANGVIAAYQQCHFSPDYWRNYTVIGTAGRLENFGDGPGSTVKVWNSGTSGYREDGDAAYLVPDASGAHAGADEATLDEFCRFVRAGGPTSTSPVSARMSVAAGYLATESLRSGGTPFTVPALDPKLVDYFDRHQPGRARRTDQHTEGVPR